MKPFQERGTIEKYFYTDLKKVYQDKFTGQWDDEKEEHLQWMLRDTDALVGSCKTFIKLILDDIPKHSENLIKRINELKDELKIT